MTIEEAIAALEAGLPNRQVDLTIHNLGSNPRLPRQRFDTVPDHVPRATSEISAAMAAFSRIAPYASYRLTYDNGMNVHVFMTCGVEGRGAMASIAICQALLRHVHSRTGPSPTLRQEFGRFHRVGEVREVVEVDRKPLPDNFIPPDPSTLGSRIGLHGLSVPAAETALALKGMLWLEADASDDAYCSAISLTGRAPRSVIDELPAIKLAVKALRG